MAPTMPGLLRTSIAVGALGFILWLGSYSTGISEVTFAATPPPPTAVVITPPPPPPKVTPTPIQGGEWKDDLYYTWQISTTTDLQREIRGGLGLKVVESLDWTQTWNVHFALGQFYQTEAVSDSVRLALTGGSTYYTTGVYTSTVFDAGRAVDWITAGWTSSGTPYSTTVEFRTGNVSIPDNTWSQWDATKVPGQYYCVSLILNPDHNECKTYLAGIDSSRYFQYRVTFNSGDATRALELYEMKVYYGIHAATGTALSWVITPIDLGSWKEVFYTSTVPANTALSVDVLAPDGTVLLSNAVSGQSLASINSSIYRSVQLRATLTTGDVSRSPMLNGWRLRWWMGPKQYLPIIRR